jgi:hypothetical protein
MYYGSESEQMQPAKPLPPLSACDRTILVVTKVRETYPTSSPPAGHQVARAVLLRRKRLFFRMGKQVGQVGHDIGHQVGVGRLLIQETQDGIDRFGIAGRNHDLFCDHIMRCQPVSDLAPVPERCTVRDLANWRGETSRPSLTGYVLVNKLTGTLDPSPNFSLSHQVAVIDANNASADFGASHILDRAQDRIFFRWGSAREVERQSPCLHADRGITATGLVQGVFYFGGQLGHVPQYQDEIVFWVAGGIFNSFQALIPVR